jgi:hypothetical protein
MWRCQISSTELSNIKSGATTFEVVATDPYGNEWSSSKLFDVNDVTYYLLYQDIEEEEGNVEDTVE